MSRSPGRRRTGRRVSVLVLVVGAVALAGQLTPRADARTDVGPVAGLDRPRAASSTTSVGGPPSTLGTSSGRLEDQPEPHAHPVRLGVEVLGIDAAISPIGATPGGELDVPGDAGLVGWYRFGVSPGGAGSAVLAGHVDLGGRVGVFARLAELEPGDEVVVTSADGSRQRFTTTARRQFAKPDLPTELVFARGGAPTLALVTCGGSFDAEDRSYRDNVVVFATPIA